MNLSKNFKKFLGLESYEEDAMKMEPSGDWQGRQDAARHLLAVGDIARKTHPLVAKVLASTYEFIEGSSSELDTKMDEHNNALALSLFNAKDYNEIKQRVQKLMEDAQYKDFYDKGKPVYVKEAP